MSLLHIKSSSLSSLSNFSTQKIFFYPTNFITFPSSLSFNSLSYITPNAPLFKTHKSLFLSQAAVETPISNEAEIEEDEEEEEDEESRTRVCAQNVPWDCSASDIRPLFEKFGTVVSVELSMYNKTRNRGLAFITMGSHEEAVAAITNLEAFEFEGRSLRLAWAKPRKKKVTPPPVLPKQVPIHNLFVANLPFQARGKDLMEFFNSENANVVSAEVIFRENPRGSAGYGFISFNTKEEADAVLSGFQGKMFMGRPIRIALSKKFLRQETKASLEQESTSSSNINSDGEKTETTTEV
ncbi:28 kDa ribonucleoprotein, chloroplastic [Heracleum sosnowskyi]|uniref:28 kDa ribonucleoprotein, chloroplastic n=1 Tax=Heracleum sosnowskyi TaxID=360622 RepID=A0AAD8JPG2_9APIA|nr:28 kDa ribonucleoprotein, chloroplastic [Heracleum sosnowskyi]